MIESLSRLGIAMDKYKTSELGKALKRVYHGQISVRESVAIAEGEIREIFGTEINGNMPKVNTGEYGEIVGKCPLCQRNVVRGKYKYGCMGYNDGCAFQMGINICKRDIPINEARRLLVEGRTAKLYGFISKKGKRFDGRLKLEGGNVVFEF